MNLFITSLILAILLIVVLNHSKFFPINPAVVFIGTFLLGTLICLVNTEWEFDISLQTMVIIITTNAVFTLGFFISYRAKHQKWLTNIIDKIRFVEVGYTERKKLFKWMIALQIFIFAYQVSFIIKIGGGISGAALIKAREWLITPGNIVLDIQNHFLFISQAIALVYAYLFFSSKKKRCYKYLCPSVLYILTQVYTTSRSGVIFYLGAIMIMAVTLTSQKNSIKTDKRKIIKTLSRFVLIVLGLFLGLGSMMGKTQYFGAWNMIAVYFGGSIYGLDYFVRNTSLFVSPSWGCNSFPIVNSLSRIMGLSNGTLGTNFPFLPIPISSYGNRSSATNLYTSIAIPACDFGILGMMLLFLLIGILYGFVFKILKEKGIKKSRITPWIIIVSYLMMPIFCAEAQYAFGAFLFAPMSVYQMFYIIVFIKLIIIEKGIEGHSSDEDRCCSTVA